MKTASPEVNIISFTQYAKELLIYTKSNRLKAGTTLAQIMGWSETAKDEHLDYMFKTIQSSFEFVTYVFEIKNVSRAFTHQLVRTRTAAYQQESQRTVDVRDNTALKTSNHHLYQMAIDNSMHAYEDMVEDGVPVQDARGVLPTAVHTNILMKADLRTLSNMSETRLCYRTQGEYQDVFKILRKKVLELHPWAEPMLQVACAKTGVCIFPNYTECPIQDYTFAPDRIKQVTTQVKKKWNETIHEAVPVAKNGRTM